MGHSEPEQPDDDLIFLKPIEAGAPVDEQTITNRLKDRFSKDIVYTRIGGNILVTVNPFKALEVNSQNSVKQYKTASKNGSETSPHVFEIAVNAYQSAVKFHQDQSIVFIGETGSGKSENFQLALRQVCSLARSKKKEDKQTGRLLKATTILEAFGHAKTVNNANSSRFGKCIEVQLNSRGKMAGAKIADFLLEDHRIAHIPFEERNFHCFYYLLAGASSDERSKWHLLDSHKYHFLGKIKANRSEVSNDVSRYAEVKTALKALGFKEKYQTQIFQLLSSILLLGNLEFIEGDVREEAALIKNHDLLDILADMFGVRPANLENALVYKTKLIKKEICTVYLDKMEAIVQRNDLARTLYSLLWSFLVESMNKRLCIEDPTSFITLVDLFGLENLKENFFHQMLYNYTAEKVLAFMNDRLFDQEVEGYRQDHLKFEEVSYGDNSQILDLFTGIPNGIFPLLNEETTRRKKGKVSTMLEALDNAHKENEFYIIFQRSNKSKLFGVKHHNADVHYDATDFLENNSETISADFVTLFKGGSEFPESKNSFIVGLFTEKMINLERAPKNDKAIVDALHVNTPRRKLSVRKSKKDKETAATDADDRKFPSTFVSHYTAALEHVLEAIGSSEVSFVVSVKSNPNQLPNKFDAKKVKAQIFNLGLPDIVHIRAKGYNVKLPVDTFLDRYRLIDPIVTGSQGAARDKCSLLLEGLGWNADDIVFGDNKVYLTETGTRFLNFRLRAAEKEERKRIKAKVAAGEMDDSVIDSQLDDQSDVGPSDDGMSATEYTTDDEQSADTASAYGSEYSYMSTMEANRAGVDSKALGPTELHVEEEEEEISSVRKYWLAITSFLTWWVPRRCLEWNGMKRADIQQAWREKLALCILIILLSALMLFFIVGLTLILCPLENQFSLGEVSNHQTQIDEWIVVQGNVYQMNVLRSSHPPGAQYVDDYAGKDASEVFPRNAEECGLTDDGTPHDKYFNSSVNHDMNIVGAILNKKSRFWQGYVAYLTADIATHNTPTSWWIIVNHNVYDMTNYRYYDQKHLGNDATLFIDQFGGQDATSAFKSSASATKALSCMNKIYFKGQVDVRDTPQCIIANTLLISATGVLVAIIVVKFLCALQLGSRGEPEDHDRFVICQVPCYTEGEEQLRRTLDSLAKLRYDDKRKLLFVIADGNIVGSGNDRATWRIVLDLLGVDPSIDPPKLSFHSLGEGNRQHNMGKIYTGLYDTAGHLVPYLVLVKVGKDTETRRPGNRGKRDSQMVLMRFLQKVHYDDPMSPLELEMYHQIKNVVGVDPSFYEFILMVDADTQVFEDSLNRMVSSMVNDAKILGICGETMLANERDSWITMMQVYEYYISHHLSKAFESLFGSVTCLPGCFCMYRIRTPNKSIPLLISKPVIADYSVNDVDTLHKKNLLALGEDRYLTTLMLKHFPNMKLSFTQDAQCKTLAPDRWSILLSQRRRWINSTVHNLSELLLLPQLCGFCCFSMRFIVFFDLFATLVMPATMLYLGYLIYEAATGKAFPLVSLILLGAAYGLQIIIFLVKRKWEHIGWLVIYLLALPLFTFVIPMYSFWHFDDFSWGTTRIVVGERGGKKQIVDEEPFDPLSIPMKRWSEYEQEMWEKESQLTGGSQQTYVSMYSHQTGMTGMTHPQSYVAPQSYGVAPPVYTPSVTGSVVTPASMQQPMQRMAVTPQPGEEYPTNNQIVSQIKTILSTANLMTVTKKQVRDELTAFFSTDMTSRKAFINKTIEELLHGKI